MKNVLPLFMASIIAIVLGACTVSTSSDGSRPADTGRGLKTSSEPLSGVVDSRDWRMGKAIAQLLDGKYHVTIVGEGVDLSCSNFFSLAPHIGFTVPGVGTFDYDGSFGTGGILVNFNFPYKTQNGGGSMNVLGDRSMIRIDQVTEATVLGNVSAISESSSEHTYEVAGSFQAELCK